ncbi:MAG TPA: hypothetical protein VLT35_06150, partial [Methanocella sp.]|nr:hypothetical protein [Methanocella sp.]
RFYDYPNYTCLDFAVALHNRAEAAGIKCAVVTVQFADQAEGHAFDAFPTGDRGVVYVDCTGINETEAADGAEPTDNVVYLREAGELGELPIGQAGGNLDYAFYLDRKGRIDAYRAQWKQYGADVAAYNAEVADRAAQVAANDQYYDAYSDDCDRFAAALDEYNRQMSQHNQGVSLGDPNAPQAPTNRDELVAWQARLDDEYRQYSATWSRLEAWRKELNADKAALNDRLNALRNAEESKWITYSPMGIVEDVESFWG